tara:strand:- start:20 stop:259 length:240 start_codon:yes stop_codon:yes gene_type:complete
MMDIITEIRKNQNEKIIVSTNEYQGHKYVDLRIHYEDKISGDYKPSKKGIALSPKVIPDVIEAIMSGFETLKSEPEVAM